MELDGERESEFEETSISVPVSAPAPAPTTSPRRQRTASENENEPGTENENENENFNESIHAITQQQILNSEEVELNNTDYDTEDTHRNTIEDNESTDIDEDEDEDNEDYYTDEEANENESMDLMNQLQSALFGAVGGNGVISSPELERLRQSINRINHSGLFSRGDATHSTQIRSILRSLPIDCKVTDPALLYSAFTELWELIVLTGEEVETYEFDAVVDLKPLVGHLLRVLKWEEECCQLYGSEFLLFAVRCTRAAVQYSPTTSRKLVDNGLIPLLSKQLFSVEYIDLAEDLIQIIQILTKPSATTSNTTAITKASSRYSLACLQSDGIRAVLGFIDFFALSVQVHAFTAAAQMATALTEETFDLYLSTESICLLRSVTRRNVSDTLNQKLVHQALQTIYNALVAAPKHADILCPISFVLEDLLPLAPLLPLDVGLIVLELVNNNFNNFLFKRTLLNQSSLTEKFIETLQSVCATSTDEILLEITLRIVIELFCKGNNQSNDALHLFDLLNFCYKTKFTSSSSVPVALYDKDCTFNGSVPFELIKSATRNLLNFYLNIPSITLNVRYLILCTLLLLDVSAQNEAQVDLFKMSVISQLITAEDPIVKIIGLEWCRALISASPSDFILTAKRQGLGSNIELKNNSVQQQEQQQLRIPKLSLDLKKWLSNRLESLNVTIFSGEEDLVFDVYVSKLSANLMENIRSVPAIDKEQDNLPFTSSGQLIELVRNGTISNFTEFEWLGDPENCLARKLLDILKSNPYALKVSSLSDLSFSVNLDLKALCQAIYRALNHYDNNYFKVSLPLTRLTRVTASNPLESLAILARPLRVNIKFDNNRQHKLMVCDPFTNISWLVKMTQCSAEEGKVILRDTEFGIGRDSNSVDSSFDQVFDTLNSDSIVQEGSFGIVNFSSTSFKTKNKRVFLLPNPQNQSHRVPLEPSESLIEIIWNNLIGRENGNEEGWKRINELWLLPITIVIEDFEIIVDDESTDIEMNITEENSKDIIKHQQVQISDVRIKLALDLLAEIPFKIPNEQLSSKLSKALNSPFIIAFNRISEHWITAACAYPFLFPFSLRISLMKSTCLGRMRGLLALQQRLQNATDVSLISLPRRKFRIYRSHILQAVRKVFSLENSGDLRLFEFEYSDELGTGHGPTMEFYALASKEFIRPSLGLFHVTNSENLKFDEIVQPEGEGLFPCWTISHNCQFQLLGSFVARAWLDDRIIDLPLHPLMISMLKEEFNHVTLEDINLIDPELWKVLIGDNLKGSGIPFLVPGSEIPLCPHGQDRLIVTEFDVEEFRISILEHINNSLRSACKSFLKGFNDSFPRSFKQTTSLFPLADLMSLFCSSRDNLSDWSVQNILSALISDHGYVSDSPQIFWLAEILSETAQNDQLNGLRNRVKMIQFLTGAAYLPIGGWKTLKPPLTIVCKAFNTTNTSGNNIFNSINTTNDLLTNTNDNNLSSSSPTISNSSYVSAENHDIYLPSVMTCANYLKLPRYSSKEIMRERLIYAVTEGFGSFHLS